MKIRGAGRILGGGGGRLEKFHLELKCVFVQIIYSTTNQVLTMELETFEMFFNNWTKKEKEIILLCVSPFIFSIESSTKSEVHSPAPIMFLNYFT